VASSVAPPDPGSSRVPSAASSDHDPGAPNRAQALGPARFSHPVGSPARDANARITVGDREQDGVEAAPVTRIERSAPARTSPSFAPASAVVRQALATTPIRAAAHGEPRVFAFSRASRRGISQASRRAISRASRGGLDRRAAT
jgi:hypothetical protein